MCKKVPLFTFYDKGSSRERVKHGLCCKQYFRQQKNVDCKAFGLTKKVNLDKLIASWKNVTLVRYQCQTKQDMYQLLNYVCEGSLSNIITLWGMVDPLFVRKKKVTHEGLCYENVFKLKSDASQHIVLLCFISLLHIMEVNFFLKQLQST